MTLDSTHAGLLRGIALNLKDRTRTKVYSDYLQEIGNIGWLIVAHYPVECWPVWTAPYRRRKAYDWRYEAPEVRTEYWKLPWLEGEYRSERHTDRADLVARWVLLAYANGEVVL